MNIISIKKVDVLAFTICLFLAQPLLGTMVCKGDPNALNGETFSGIINLFNINSMRRNLYVTWRAPFPEGAKEFSFCVMNRNSTTFTSLAPAKIKINGFADLPNPLYNLVDNPMIFLSLVDEGTQGTREYPIFVLQNDPSSVFILDAKESGGLMWTPRIPDAVGMRTSGIVQIEGCTNQIVGAAGGSIIAAVKPSKGGTFGDIGSGIALIKLGVVAEKESEGKKEDGKKPEDKKKQSLIFFAVNAAKVVSESSKEDNKSVLPEADKNALPQDKLPEDNINALPEDNSSILPVGDKNVLPEENEKALPEGYKNALPEDNRNVLPEPDKKVLSKKEKRALAKKEKNGIVNEEKKDSPEKDGKAPSKDDEKESPENQKKAVFRAAALDKTSNFIKIKNDLLSMENAVTMHFNPYNSLWYVGLQVQAGADAGSGARAIVVVKLLSDHAGLDLINIAPAAAFNASNQIVGALGANQVVTIHEIGSMRTSTYLPYLIVRGGNGQAEDTQNSVYALPLVSGNKKEDADPNGTIANKADLNNTVANKADLNNTVANKADLNNTVANKADLNGTVANKNVDLKGTIANKADLNGTIANKNVDPEDHFWESGMKFFSRTMTAPATMPVDMPTSDDMAAQVGGGVLMGVGEINYLFAAGDSVFVTTSGNAKSGLFYSQAMFASNGTIKSWTQWRRYAGATGNLWGAILDEQTALVTYFTGQTPHAINTVKRAYWSSTDDGGGEIFNSRIKHINGLIDLPLGTPALDQVSQVMVIGQDSLALVQTGSGVGIGEPTITFSSSQSFQEGIIKNPIVNDPAVITISGGALGDIGPLTAAEIARNGNNGDQAWIFCGGCRGLAVLANPDGSGIAGGQLGSHFSGLEPAMSFVKLGNYSIIRKLVSDGNYLFVLTDTQLDRIDLTAGNPTPDNFDQITTTLVTRAQLPLGVEFGGFLDLVVSGKLALLGTTGGLFRVANNNDITKQAVQWTWVPVPEGVGSVLKLYAVSKTGRAQDVAALGGGQIYVLTADRMSNRSRVSRFVVADVAASGEIDNLSLVLFPDFYIKNMPSFLASLGEFRDFFVTDGAFGFHARTKELRELANIKFLLATSHHGNTSVQAPVNIAASLESPHMVQVSALGSWLIGTDLGLQINQ